MSKRELWHPHVMGQIMLLSLVTSHELSMVIPLVGRLALFGGGLSLWSSMRGGLIQNREADEETPPTQRGREDLILTQEGYMIPPPPGRAEKRTEERYRIASRTDQKNRHDEVPLWGQAPPPYPEGGTLGSPFHPRKGTLLWVYSSQPPLRSPSTPGEALDPPPLSGWGVRLRASLCVIPRRGGG